MLDPKYIFGGDTELTPEDLKRRRDIAQMMMRPGTAPANVGEGIYDASRKIAGALMAKKLDAQSLEMAKKAEAEAMAASMGVDATNAAGSSAFDAFFGGSSGGGFDYTAPPPQPWQPTAGAMSEVFANARPNPGLGYSGVSKINANNPFAIPGGFQV